MDFDFLLQQGSSIFIRVVSAIIVLLLGLIIGKLMDRFIQKVLAELEVNTMFKDMVDIRLPIDRFAGTIASLAIYTITVIIALQQLKIITSVLYLVIGALTLIVIAGMLIGLKDFFPNTIAYFELRKKIPVGSTILYNSMQLKIIAMGILETQTENKKGEVLFFPNAQIRKYIESKQPKKRSR